MLLAAGAIVGAAGYLVTASDAWHLVRRQFRPLSISASAALAEQPFASTFEIKNDGDLFPLSNVTFTCHLDQVVFAGNLVFKEVDAKTAHVSAKLAPGKSLQYACVVPAILTSSPVEFAKVRITVEYESIFGKAATKSDTFHWWRTRRSWSQGDLAF